MTWQTYWKCPYLIGGGGGDERVLLGLERLRLVLGGGGEAGRRAGGGGLKRRGLVARRALQELFLQALQRLSLVVGAQVEIECKV